MSALALVIICLIGSTLALIGFVLVLAFVNSAQFTNIVDRTGLADFDHRDHRNPRW